MTSGGGGRDAVAAGPVALVPVRGPAGGRGAGHARDRPGAVAVPPGRRRDAGQRADRGSSRWAVWPCTASSSAAAPPSGRAAASSSSSRSPAPASSTSTASCTRCVNQASALLIVGSSAQKPVQVSRKSIAGAPRGVPLGIPDAPDPLPARGALAGHPWTVCSAVVPGGGRPAVHVDWSASGRSGGDRAGRARAARAASGRRRPPAVEQPAPPDPGHRVRPLGARLGQPAGRAGRSSADQQRAGRCRPGADRHSRSGRAVRRPCAARRSARSSW